jgi:hypothetical protein
LPIHGRDPGCHEQGPHIAAISVPIPINQFEGKVQDMVELNHPQLGLLNGVLHHSNVRQFYNLPFAIAGRFEDSILKSGKLSENVYDATKPGYTLNLFR